MGTRLDALTKKITLVEMDLGQLQTLFFNWTAGVWYVDFDAVYERIDPIYLVGISAQPAIPKVGSVMEDGVQLTSVASAALCVSTDSSFYYDIVDRRLYLHLGGGAEPAAGHVVVFGITYGVANHACDYNSMHYEPRLRSASVLTKSKDRLFFGRVSFDGGSIGIKNSDGAYDQLASAGSALWGGAIRVLQGFDDDAYGAFLKMASGLAEGLSISRDLASVRMVDKRKFLSRRAPRRTYSIGAYPNINYTNLGKPIQLVYGDCKRVPCVCTNEDGASPFSFKICDCADHANGIQSIDAVYVDKVLKVPDSTSLTTGEFTLASAKYTPGQEVTASVHGLLDGSSVLIENGADVILDLLITYLGLTFTATYFNTTEWAAATAVAMDVGLCVIDAVEVFQIIEDVCASTFLNFIQQDDGVFTLRAYDPLRAVSETYSQDQLMETPEVRHDTSQVITSTDVGYDRDWAAGSFQRLHDTSHEAAIYDVYKIYREQKFDTLLTSATAAQTFSDTVMAIAGKALTWVKARFKLQPVGRELMDFVMLPVYRQDKAMLGMQKCEISSISKDLLGASVTLEGVVV